MLVALLTAWLLGGSFGSSPAVGYVDHLTSYAESRIADNTQRAAVLDVAKALRKAGSEEASASAKSASSVIKTAKRREATPDEFAAALSQIRDHSATLQKQLVQQRFRLKSTLTREQWNELHGNPARDTSVP
jgi:hypothetical protein